MKSKGNSPLGHFLAGRKSLERAKRIAEALGQGFDPRKTASDADQLHKVYFEEIANCVWGEKNIPRYNGGVFRNVNAFAGLDSQGGAHVGIDEILDFWLMDLTHLTVVAACVVLPENRYRKILDAFKERLAVRMDPYSHEESRDGVWPFMEDYSEILFQLSHPISKAMFAFVACHELAHCSLGHLSSEVKNEIELDADRLGAKFFLKLVDRSDQLTNMKIDDKLVGAPLLLQEFFALNEVQSTKATGILPSRATHPAPSDRVRVIREVLDPRLVGKAKYLYDGLQAALHEIARNSGLAG